MACILLSSLDCPVFLFGRSIVAAVGAGGGLMGNVGYAFSLVLGSGRIIASFSPVSCVNAFLN